jgi:outer membrane protein OmpA-like peptidoglycan-associated protein
MRVWILFIGLIIFWPNQTLLGQEASRRSIPLVVSHLSSENKALLRRKAAPKHNIISRIICFKKICRGFIGWRKKQRSMRFKGYKSGGKLPPIRTIKPTILKDSLPTIVSKSPIKVDTLNSHEQVLILDEVLFEINSAHLIEAFTYQLDSLIQFLSTHQAYRVSISGHTDNTGNEDHNLSLSNARAGAVAAYVKKNNIAGHRISFEGLGSTKPIASNETEEGRKKNRRVEIIVSEY